MSAADLAEIARLRAQLWTSGYRAVPLLSANDPDPKKAGKAPIHRDWTKRARRSPPEAAVTPALAHLSNTGILCDGLRVVDADIDSGSVADAVEECAIKHLGAAPTRRRDNSARFAMVYRAAEGEPGKRELKGAAGKLEILGKGQQCVAYGGHVSGGHLYWSGPEPLDLPRDRLPAVTEAQVTRFFEAVAPIIGADAPSTPKPRAQAGNGATPPALARLAEALALIPSNVADDYHSWIRVGAALHHESHGSDEGMAVWADWAAKSSKFASDETEARWASFANGHRVISVGAGTIFHLAVPYGWRPPDLADDPGYLAALEAAACAEAAPQAARGWRLAGQAEIFPAGCHFKVDVTTGQRWVFEPLGAAPSRGDEPSPGPAEDEPDGEYGLPEPGPRPAPKPDGGPLPPQPEPIDLSVLRINRRPAPPLPLDVFGAHWESWIRHAAEAACCPVDYVAAPVISLSSAAIGNARWAQASPGWVEPPHLWLGSVGDSGDGKSPGSTVVLGKVRAEIERRMVSDFPDRLREWQATATLAKVRKQQFEDEVAKAARGKKPPPPMPDDLDPGPEPQEPRLCCQDVTVERVATLLATAAPKGLLMVRDELAGFLLGMTAYSDAARPFWLEAFGGRPYSVDRQKYVQQIRIRHNVVAWFGTIQPERLNELMAEPDDGLLARFAWMWPEPIPFNLTERAPDIEFAIRAFDRLRLLSMIEIDGKPEPLWVPLCSGARERMVAFGREMQRRKDVATGLLRSAFGKARGLALRLSLVLELLWWSGFDSTDAPPKAIGEKAFAAACRLVADYLLPMAERTYGDAACSQEDRNTAVLARWLRDATPRPTEVHVRTMQREERLPGLTKAPDIHAACQSLVDAGWLLPAPKGRKVSGVLVAYPVNPALWGALAGAP